MKRLTIVVMLALLSSTGAWAQGWALTPGSGVGPLTINMTRDDAERLLNTTENYKGSVYVKYGGEDNVLIQYSMGRAVMISVYSQVIKTKTGPREWALYRNVGIGTPWTAAESNLGRNYVSSPLKVAKSQARETYYAYKNLGLGFRTRAGVIIQVDVFEK